jgi:hypothetical protein
MQQRLEHASGGVGCGFEDIFISVLAEAASRERLLGGDGLDIFALASAGSVGCGFEGIFISMLADAALRATSTSPGRRQIGHFRFEQRYIGIMTLNCIRRTPRRSASSMVGTPLKLHALQGGHSFQLTFQLIER